MEKSILHDAESKAKPWSKMQEESVREPFLSVNEKEKDLEGQTELKSESTERAAEVLESGTMIVVWLITYFFMNLSLTFYNKAVLGSFSYPWILTAVHTGTAALGSWLLLLMGRFELTPLTSSEHLTLAVFSLLFTINIAISNVSLAMVSVPFHQVMRAMCPVVTMLIYRVVFARKYSPATYASILPIVGGVGLATYGDYTFTALGLTLTLLGVLLASIKTVVTNRLMTGRLRLPVFEVLLRVGPLAAVQALLYSVLTGEFADFATSLAGGDITRNAFGAVLGNGLFAFLLNVASFQTNKLAGALSLTVCANLKQCLTIGLGALVWDLPISNVHASGIVLAVLGGAWYSSIELKAKRKAYN